MVTTRIIGPTSQPSQQDVLNSILSQASTSVNCAKVGVISSYNTALNTAEVKIAAQAELSNGKIFDYPLLVDCPVFRIVGGSAYLTMPIEPGDGCLIVFNDFDIDNWWAAGLTPPYVSSSGLPATSRKHSIADGFVLVGFNSVPDAVPALPGIVELFAGANKLALGNATVSLKYIIDQLFTILEGAMVQVAATPYPFTAATIAQLTALQTQADLLLDQGSSPL